MELYISYFKVDKNIGFGQTSGSIIEISNNFLNIKKEDTERGVTKIPANFQLFDKLVTGRATINVKKTTPNKCIVDENPDLKRLEATKFITENESKLQETINFPKDNDEGIYKGYIKKYLEEFTHCTKHIPFKNKLDMYPLPLLTPCNVKILIGRDGVGFIFDSEIRPEKVTIMRDTSKIIDQLILPHPPQRKYSTLGPNTILRQICDNEHTISFVGDGNFAITSKFGNPGTLIYEKKYHAYYHNIGFQRNYPDDGTNVKQFIEFAEFFGDISISNYSIEDAKKRARIFAYKSAISKISSKINKIDDIKDVINDFEEKIGNEKTSEAELEKIIDENPWIIEKGLGYKKFHSQISIPFELLDEADGGIKPDKYVENSDGYCDILDLKKATAQIIVLKKNRSHQCSSLTEADAQLNKYIDFSIEPKVKEYLREKSITILKPDGIALIGRTPKEHLKEWSDIKKRLSIKVITYDELLDRLKNIVNWIEKIIA